MRKYVITQENSHGFKIGTVVTLTEDDGSNMPGVTGKNIRGTVCQYWVRYTDMREYIPWYTRLYRGIMGALFGPESHAVNRYENKEATK